MIHRIRDALGWLTGSFLGVLVIVALVMLPVMVVLWIGGALGVGWALVAQLRIAMWVADVFATANELLPPWGWFAMITLLWLAFLDVHVRGLVRDEFSKQLKSFRERKLP